MKCNAINSNLNFAGKYRLDANQTMPNQDACLKRDYMLGVACGYAYNGDEVSKNLADFWASRLLLPMGGHDTITLW